MANKSVGIRLFFKTLFLKYLVLTLLSKKTPTNKTIQLKTIKSIAQYKIYVPTYMGLVQHKAHIWLIAKNDA